MKNKFKEDLLEVLKNLRCIDCTSDVQVDTYVDDSIHIIEKLMGDIEKETAPEVPVQEQLLKLNEIHVNSNEFIKLITMLQVILKPIDLKDDISIKIKHNSNSQTINFEYFKSV